MNYTCTYNILFKVARSFWILPFIYLRRFEQSFKEVKRTSLKSHKNFPARNYWLLRNRQVRRREVPNSSIGLLDCRAKRNKGVCKRHMEGRSQVYVTCCAKWSRCYFYSNFKLLTQKNLQDKKLNEEEENRRKISSVWIYFRF